MSTIASFRDLGPSRVKLWQAHSSLQKIKENITFFRSVILRDIRA